MNQLSSDEEYVGPSPQVYSKIEFKVTFLLLLDQTSIGFNDLPRFKDSIFCKTPQDQGINC